MCVVTKQSARWTLLKWPSDYHYFQMKVYHSAVLYDIKGGAERESEWNNVVLCIYLYNTLVYRIPFRRGNGFSFMRWVWWAQNTYRCTHFTIDLVWMSVITQYRCTDQYIGEFSFKFPLIMLRKKCCTKMKFSFGLFYFNRFEAQKFVIHQFWIDSNRFEWAIVKEDRSPLDVSIFLYVISFKKIVWHFLLTL